MSPVGIQPIFIYLPTFSEILVRDFYPGSAGIFEDDMIIFEDSRRSPKSSEDVRSLPKAETALAFPSPSLRTRINVSSLPVLFTFDHFAHGFRSFKWVWVNIVLEIVSSKMATTHIFQRNLPKSELHFQFLFSLLNQLLSQLFDVVVVALSLLVALPHKIILDVQRFCLKEIVTAWMIILWQFLFFFKFSIFEYSSKIWYS